MRKKLLSIILCLCMMLMLLPAAASAETVTGEGYSFDTATGVLTITSNEGTANGSSKIDKDDIASAVIQNTVTSIRDYAFSECAGLTSITIPDSVTSIGTGAFIMCTGLTSVTIPNSVTSIGEDAFNCDRGLTSITIPDSVTSIGTSAFSACEGLTSITIPDSVSSIGDGAFNGCAGLKKVTFEGTGALTIDSWAFTEMAADCKFYKTSESKSITGEGAPSEITVADTPADPTWPENPFKDVKSGDWYHDSVKYVQENKLMVGTSDTTFEPNATTDRGMIVTILYRLDGEPSVEGLSNFPDVPSDKWYANAVAWAKDKSISVGNGNGNFGAADDLTREQLATMFYRYAQMKGMVLESDTALKFTDSASVSSWAETAIKWCVENGIITGKGNGILDPKGKATRAEMATIIQRFVEKMKEA